MSTTLGIKAPAPPPSPAARPVEASIIVDAPASSAPSPMSTTLGIKAPPPPPPAARPIDAGVVIDDTLIEPTLMPSTAIAAPVPEVFYPPAAGLSPTVDDELRARAASPSEDNNVSVVRARRADSTGTATGAMLAAARGNDSRKLIALGAGAVALLVIAIVLVMRGGDDKPAPVAANDPASTKASAPVTAPVVETRAEPAVATESASTVKTTGTPGSATGAAATEPVADEPTEPTPPEEVAAVEPTTTSTPEKRTTTPRVAKKIGGKQVVLEYDTTAKGPAPATAVKEDGAAVARARASYVAGNKRLFAGDPDGAIRAYQQSLAIYPGYVAGYRGLGLAYTQKGDKAKALKALRTYVGTVPGAKDASLIRKRIASLRAR